MGIRGEQVNDGELQRRDMDTQTPGQAMITQLDVTGAGKPTMTQSGAEPGTGKVTLDFPAPGGSAEPWHGQLYGAWGDCNPIRYAGWMDMVSSVNGPTPTQIAATVARCVRFQPPAAMTMGKVYIFGVAAVTGLYKFAIYRTTDNAKIWESGAVNAPAGAWLTLAVSPTVQLAADVNYWFCVTVSGTGTTAGFRSPGAPLHANLFGNASAGPLGNTSYGLGIYAQFAVTGGAFPATLPALAAAAYAGGTTGSVPYAFLGA